MANQLSVSVGFRKKNVLKVGPMKLLSEILEEVCNLNKLDPKLCELRHEKKVLDLSLSVRFANLPPRAILEVYRENVLASEYKESPPISSPPPQIPSTPATVTSALPQPPTVREDVPMTETEVVPRSSNFPTPDPRDNPSPLQAASQTSSFHFLPRENQIGRVEMTEAPPPASEGIKIVWPEPKKEAVKEDLPQGAAESSGAESMEESMSAIERELGRRIRLVPGPLSSDHEAPETEEPGSGGDLSSGGIVDDPDDSFYEFTAEDWAREEKARKQRQAEEQRGHMRTERMRLAEQDQRAQALGYAVIRVRFPDRVEIEAEFKPLEETAALHSFLNRCFRSESGVSPPKFHLFTTPPKQLVLDCPASLFSVGLAPAALVHLAFEGELKEQSKPTCELLREQLLELVGERNESLLRVVQRGTSSHSSVANNVDSRVDGEQKASSHSTQDHKKKSAAGKPKWLKL